MVDENLLREAMKWCKENGYDNLLNNEDLVVALYRKRVLKENIRNRGGNAKFKKLSEVKEGENGKFLVVVVEKVKERLTKSGKWQVWFVGGDDSEMMDFISFPFEQKPDIEEGKYYLVYGFKKEDMYMKKVVVTYSRIEEVDKEVVDKASLIVDFVETMGNKGRIKKEKIDRLFNGSSEELKSKVKSIIGLVDNGEEYVLAE